MPGRPENFTDEGRRKGVIESHKRNHNPPSLLFRPGQMKRLSEALYSLSEECRQAKEKKLALECLREVRVLAMMQHDMSKGGTVTAIASPTNLKRLEQAIRARKQLQKEPITYVPESIPGPGNGTTGNDH